MKSYEERKQEAIKKLYEIVNLFNEWVKKEEDSPIDSVTVERTEWLSRGYRDVFVITFHTDLTHERDGNILYPEPAKAYVYLRDLPDECLEQEIQWKKAQREFTREAYRRLETLESVRGALKPWLCELYFRIAYIHVPYFSSPDEDVDVTLSWYGILVRDIMRLLEKIGSITV